MAFKGLPYYWGAIAAAKSIRAIIFMFLPGKNADKVTLDTCTGWVRHMGRFYENKTYSFVFDVQLTKGDVEVSLLNQKKQTLLKFSRRFPSQTISLDGRDSKYYLRWEFKNASGKCALHW